MQKALWLQERTLLSPASRSTGEAPGPQKRTVDVKVGCLTPTPDTLSCSTTISNSSPDSEKDSFLLSTLSCHVAAVVPTARG